MDDGPAHIPDVLPIVRLVREKVAGRELRPFAKERGIPYSTIRYYADEHLPPLTQLPRPATRQQLADALRVTRDRIDEAARASLEGVYQPDGSVSRVPQDTPTVSVSIEDAIRQAADLLPEAKEHLLNQVALLRRIQGPQPVSLPERRARTQMRKVLDGIDEVTPSEPERPNGGPAGRGGRPGSRGAGR